MKKLPFIGTTKYDYNHDHDVMGNADKWRRNKIMDGNLSRMNREDLLTGEYTAFYSVVQVVACDVINAPIRILIHSHMTAHTGIDAGAQTLSCSRPGIHI